MKTMTMAVIAGLAVAGCSPTTSPAPGVPVAIEGDSIRYATAPCFGTCPVYVVTVRPDGAGTFEGIRFTTVTGTRSFRATPEQYRRFAAALQPYRPDNGEKLYEMGTPLCGGPAPTDMPGVDIRWTEASGGAQHLSLYYGCGDQQMRDALRSAPQALPLGDFIKPAPDPR